MIPKTLLAAGAALALATGAATQAKGMAKLKLIGFDPGQYSKFAHDVPVTPGRYDLAANRLIFTQRRVRVVVTMGEDDLDGEVEINGLANPDIQIVRGAELTLDVVNVSSIWGEEYLLVRPAGPPYRTPLTVASSQEQVGPYWGRWRIAGRMKFHMLPTVRMLDAIADVKVTYRAETTGIQYYHGPFVRARQGEYGRIIVVP